ncbi:hypothetical protein Tco_0317324 [Tanacetum coccineum]
MLLPSSYGLRTSIFSLLHNYSSSLDINTLNTSSIGSSISSTVISGPTLTELKELSGESKLHAMIREMEHMDHQLDVVDNMNCLRDAVRGEYNKLASLTQLVDQVNDGIREKEAHMDIMDLCD